MWSARQRDMDIRKDIQDLIDAGLKEAETPDQVVRVCRNLFDTIRRGFEPILGSATTMALMENAIAATRVRHPIVELLHATGDRVFPGNVRELAEGTTASEVRSAFECVIRRFLDSIHVLAGNIMTRHLSEILRGESRNPPQRAT